mmetsp:Transcript_21163/g.47720  ORF Transcript_21163/g.47720 Transcript_21163/m.47720 type:complete len:214 (+) Transcript_21163:5049-5690(+)
MGIHVRLSRLAAVGAIPEPLVVHARIAVRILPGILVGGELLVPTHFLLPRRNLGGALGQALVGLQGRQSTCHCVQVQQRAEAVMLGHETMLPFLLHSVVVEFRALQIAIGNSVQVAPRLGLVHVNGDTLGCALTQLLACGPCHAKCILLRQKSFIVPRAKRFGGWVHSWALDEAHMVFDAVCGVESHHILTGAEHSRLMRKTRCAGWAHTFHR